MKNSKKRIRSTNWEQTEKELLRELATQYITVIENKTTDTNTNTEKKKAWLAIHKRFNDLNNNSKMRELNHIQQQWRTMKQDAKKALSDYKQSIRNTGGAEKPKADHLALIVLLSPEFEQGDNMHDCGGGNVSVEEQQRKATQPAPCSSTVEEINTVNIEESFDASSLATSHPEDNDDSQTKKKTSLHLTKKKKKVSTSDDWQEQIIQVVETDKESIRLLYKQKIDLEMELLREQHSLEIKMKKEKHDFEMKILKEKLNNIPE